jgi:hypothetical protein
MHSARENKPRRAPRKFSGVKLRRRAPRTRRAAITAKKLARARIGSSAMRGAR